MEKETLEKRFRLFLAFYGRRREPPDPTDGGVRVVEYTIDDGARHPKGSHQCRGCAAQIVRRPVVVRRVGQLFEGQMT